MASVRFYSVLLILLIKDFTYLLIIIVRSVQFLHTVPPFSEMPKATLTFFLQPVPHISETRSKQVKLSHVLIKTQYAICVPGLNNSVLSPYFILKFSVRQYFSTHICVAGLTVHYKNKPGFRYFHHCNADTILIFFKEHMRVISYSGMKNPYRGARMD